MRRRLRPALATLATLVPLLAACAPPADQTPTAAPLQEAVWRGDRQHTGVGDPIAVHHAPRLVWAFPTQGPVRSSPVMTGGMVFFGSGDGHLYALRAESGEEVWKLATGGPVHGSPAVADGIVFAASADRHFYAADARTGAERWRFATGEELPFRWGWDYFLSSPVIADGIVYFGSGDGHLYALDAATGDQRWRFQTGGRVRSSPAWEDGRLYFGSMDGRLYALRAASGEEIWRFEPEGAKLDSARFGFDRTSVQSSPALDAGTVVVGSRDGFLYAVGSEDGDQRWRFDHKVSWVVSSPAIFGDLVLTGSSDGFFLNALDLATGEERWRFKTGGNVFSSPAVADGVVYFGCFDDFLYALDAADGTERWRFRAGGSVMSSPAVAGGRVYFGSDDGHLYALTGVTDPDWAPPRRAVYWEDAWSYYQGGEALRDYLAAEGYEVLDGAALAAFLEESGSSVVVFARDLVPAAVADEPLEESLLRRYLEAGGKVVWVGFAPGALVLDPETGRPGLDLTRPGKLIGVEHEGMQSDEIGSAATADGRRWGLGPWWVGSQAVAAAEVTTVLGTDEHGRASAWVKGFGGPEGTGFVRFWGRRRPLPDPAVVKAVAEYGF